MHPYNLSAKVVSHIMGYYKYKSIWIPFVFRNINTPNGTRKRFGQMRWRVLKNGSVVVHWVKWDSGKVAKTFFFSAWTN